MMYAHLVMDGNTFLLCCHMDCKDRALDFPYSHVIACWCCNLIHALHNYAHIFCVVRYVEPLYNTALRHNVALHLLNVAL